MDSNTIPVIVGLIGLVGGLFVLWLGLKMQNLANELRKNGISSEAEITAKRDVRSSSRGRVNYTRYVTFRFDVVGADGKTTTYTQEQEVGPTNYSALSEGAKTQILYLPRNPGGTARLATRDNTSITGAYSLGSGCLIAGVFLLIIGVSSTSAITSQANATQTHVATLGSDLAVVRAALEPHFAAWKEIADQTIHRVSSAEVGLSSVTQETIVYGYCGDIFYVYVPRSFKEGRTPNIHYSDNAYGYTSKPTNFCWPPDWSIVKEGDLSNGWFLTMLLVIDSTPTPSPQ
jgi:arginine exporter protein ArgO